MNKNLKKKYIIYLAVAATVILGLVLINLFFDLKISIGKDSFFYKFFGSKESASASSSQKINSSEQEGNKIILQVLPQAGVEIPAIWGDLGKQLTDAGVIDENQFRQIYSQRGGLSREEEKMLSGSDNGKLIINQQNSNFILNMLWALGLGNKNDILDNGEIQDKKYGGAGRFASTGGWSLAKGDAMSHFSKHKFIQLTPEQQALVDNVSKNIYRPCCGNSTNFPDCNHGMAMLGLLELMASQGATEQNMYKIALAVNSYWFPNNYLTLASYFKDQGISWDKVDPKTVLGFQYSSLPGYRQIEGKTTPQVAPSTGGGCGV